MLFICITSVQREQIKYSKVLFLVIQILFILLQKQKPTGGVPGKDMRIKESDLLKKLATDSGKTAKQVSEIVVSDNEDCPECGGEMEVTDGEYKQTGGDGYLTPPEYTAIWEEKTCTHCGHKESNEPSY